MDAALLARLIPLSQPLAAPEGAVLFRPGDPCGGFLLLQQGSVRVELLAPDGHALLLYRLGPGDACALTIACLFAQEAYGAEARAETAIAGRLLPAAAFQALMADSADFRAFVMAGFGARMAALLERIETLSFRPVDARLAALLLARGPVLAATQAEIAVEIGSAREVVSRRLAGLARLGAVELARGEVRVLDPGRLRRLAENDAAM